ncbi:MAG: aminopeptidase P family protein [Pseudomonadota bacterium]
MTKNVYFQSFTPQSDRSYASKHLPLLRTILGQQGLDGFVVPHDDEYLNEYLPACAERLMWVTGFSGSAGTAIIMVDRAVIFTDGRYTLQVRQEVDDAFFSFESVPETSPAQWLEKNIASGSTIGYDPMLHSKKSVSLLEKAAASGEFNLIAAQTNPIDVAWNNRPEKPMGPILIHDDQYAGEKNELKIQKIAKNLSEINADTALITSPASVAWLFNIRGTDVKCTPLALARALIHENGTATFYVAYDRLDKSVIEHLGPSVEIKPETMLDDDLKALATAQKTVAVDPNLSPNYFAQLLEQHGATIKETRDPCELPRAIKNETELEGTRRAHHRDGVAMTRFLHWLETNAQDGSVDEITAAKQLETFRADTGKLKDLSFETISGSGPDGAIVHYRVTEKTNRPLNLGELYLVDSGAQYEDGTTDITRVVAIGEPTSEMKDRYTRVLKGHIALATAVFPKGTSGDQLDTLARLPLWAAGLDYAHGTGHGVGSFLSVHEGPQRIAKVANGIALEPGMILSNEPGYYKTNAYGIRIENLIIVQPVEKLGKKTPNLEHEMLGFETLTLAPISLTLIQPSLLSDSEKNWLNQYHVRVRNSLMPDLPDDTREWLEQATQPI